MILPAGLLLSCLAAPQGQAALGPPDPQDGGPGRGLVSSSPGALEGYTLVGPLSSRAVQLVDLEGQVVHRWTTSTHAPGGGCYLEDNGHLLRCGRLDANPRFHGGGIGGVIEEFDWDGNLVWSYTLMDEFHTQHHDIERLPNGNVLAIVWEYLEPDEARAFGRDPEVVGRAGLWPDAVLEIEPAPPQGGRVVWEWHAWDHLIQDFDPELANYGSIPEEPGRIDINADHRDQPAMTTEQRAAEQALHDQMRALGYVGGEEEDDGAGRDRPGPPDGGPEGGPAGSRPGGHGPGAGGPPRGEDRRRQPDWLHTNGLSYLPRYDLIALSSPHLCEVFVIDHSTTTEEAASDRGGRFGRGGELLWRWGNPRNYGRGERSDQRLFYQHDPTWVETDEGLGLLIFNNGSRRPDGDYSTVVELRLPFDPQRGFRRDPGAPFGPREPSWQQRAAEPYFSGFISGAQRLPNGNTLICSGAPGRIFEVTPTGEIVWDYLNPYGGDAPSTSQSGKAPAQALFRAYRFAKDDPAVSRLRGGARSLGRTPSRSPEDAAGETEPPSSASGGRPQEGGGSWGPRKTARRSRRGSRCGGQVAGRFFQRAARAVAGRARGARRSTAH